MNRIFKRSFITFKLVILIAVIIVGVNVDARAATSNGSYAWSPPTTSTNTSGPASAPANDTAFNPLGYSYSYFAQGTEVYAVRNVADADGPAGSFKWAFNLNSAGFGTPTPVTLPVTLSNGQEVVFITGEDGNLYKINAVDTTTLFVNLQETGCATDKLAATIAVQLYNLSNATFKAAIDAVPGHSGDDLVFVITRYDHEFPFCLTSANRIYALWASDLSLKWVYNLTGAIVMGPGVGCVVEIDQNTLFCGTNQVASTDSSLWALNTSTTLISGSARWAVNAGSIQVRPTLAVTTFGTRVYVGTDDGSIKAYDAANGTFLWTGGVATIAPFAMAHAPAMFKDNLLVVDSAGNLNAIQDLGSSGTLLWSMGASADGTVRFSSAPVVVESLGKAYVGRNDGTIQEIDLATVQAGDVVVVNSGAVVYDPSLDIEGGASDFNRLVVVADAIPGLVGGVGQVTRLIIPFNAASVTAPVTTGTNVTVDLGSQVDITFSSVSSGGTATALLVLPGSVPAPPTNFQIVGGTSYDITTDAGFTGNVQVCIGYDPATITVAEQLLRLLHYSGGTWTDITSSVDTVNKKVCGLTSSLSIFAVFEPVPFSTISAKLRTFAGPPPSFDLNASFTLGVTSDGIDPLVELVALQVGTYSATIPAGSFKQLKNGSKQNTYAFSGVIDGVTLSIQIVPPSVTGDGWSFKASGIPVNLTGLSNPVTVVITIGNDSGTTGVNANF
jgi:hypothetical protein